MAVGPAALSHTSMFSTRLLAPASPRDFVVRPRLHDRLDAGRDCRLILVSAPAGFGKTTLVAGWLRSLVRPWAWLALDEADNDLETFVRALVASIRTVYPEIGARTLGLFAQTELPPLSLLGLTLADELAQAGADLAIVLDDYEVLNATPIHVVLSSMLRRLPPSVQLIVATRVEPPLPVAVLRARGQLVEIRAKDLAFDIGEIAGFVERACGIHLSEAALSDLHRSSAGWPVALRLAVLTADRPADVGPRIAPQVDAQQFVDTYLFDEVLARQTPDLQRLLVSSAILDRLSGPLCEALLPELQAGRGSDLLEQAERTGLFLISLGQHGHWLHYHDVFREALLRRLTDTYDQSEIRALHARASAWYADQRLIEEAVEHALAAGDIDRAIRLVEQTVDAWLVNQEWGAIERCLRRLPAEKVERSPAIGLAAARMLLIRGRLQQALARVDEVERQLLDHGHELHSTIRRTAHGEIAAVRSLALFFRNDQDELAYQQALTALELAPAHHAYLWGNAANVYAVASQLRGFGEEALAWVRERLHEVSDGDSYTLGRLLLGQAFIELASGRFGQLEHTCRQVVAVSTRHLHDLDRAWGHWGLGRVSYEWGDLDKAREQYMAALALRDQANVRCTNSSTIGLALSLLASGRASEALRLTLDALELAKALHQMILVEQLRSLAARLALSTGDLQAANSWIDAVGTSPALSGPFDLENPRLTRARVLLACDSRTSLIEAASLLEQVHARAEARHDVPTTVETLTLSALVTRAQGDTSSALAMLGRALALGEAGRFVRTFTDFGPPLAGLLVELIGQARSGGASAGAERVLRAYRGDAGGPESAVPSRTVAPSDLVEPLSWRELEVLQLLSGRLTNKEIAQALCVSPETVKKHVAHIFGKLQVSGRRDAVTRGHVLGLLGEDGRR